MAPERRKAWLMMGRSAVPRVTQPSLPVGPAQAVLGLEMVQTLLSVTLTYSPAKIAIKSSPLGVF